MKDILRVIAGFEEIAHYWKVNNKILPFYNLVINIRTYCELC